MRLLLSAMSLLACVGIFANPADKEIEKKIDRLISSMAFEEKIGQIPLYYSDRTSGRPKEDRYLNLPAEIAERLQEGLHPKRRKCHG